MTHTTHPRQHLLLTCCLGVLLWLPGISHSNDKAPKRVVSMNVCTDQMALLLGDPGQLISVSYMAHDPDMAVMAEQAKALPSNRGLAEEIFELAPDLVLTGTFSDQATLHLLRHLGHRVETFPPAYSFKDIRTNLRKMGELLHQSERAEAIIADFDQRLAALKATQPESSSLTAVSYGANLYVQGKSSLEREVVEQAGLTHYGTSQGFDYGGRVSLEAIVMNPPDILLMDDYQKGMQAHAHLAHPALAQSVPEQQRTGIPSKYMICGLPSVLDAVTQLSELREQLQTAKESP